MMDRGHGKCMLRSTAKANLVKPACNRLKQSYPTFDVIAMFKGCASLFVISFGDYRHEASPGLRDVLAGLLTSALMTAVVALLVTAMLLVYFQYCDAPGSYESVVAWLPVVLVDIVIIEFLIGLVVRCQATMGVWPAALMGCELAVLMAVSSMVVFHLWRTMNQKTSHVAAATSGGESKARVRK